MVGFCLLRRNHPPPPPPVPFVRFALLPQLSLILRPEICDLMVGALDSGASGPGSSPGRGHCVVFFSKSLNSRSASLHPGV